VTLPDRRRIDASTRRPARASARVAPLLCMLALLGAPGLVGCRGSGGSGDIVLSGVRPANQRLAEAQELVRDAQEHAQLERHEEAISAYREALRIYDDFPAAWHNLGVLLMRQERYLEAADAFASASERAASDPRPLFNLALTWERASYIDEALDHYKRALKRDARYLPAIRGAARAEAALGVADESSVERLRTALMIERDPRWRAYFEQQRLRVRSILDRRGDNPLYSGE